jgi:serine/threonine protein phosphatase PrpC
VIIYINQEKIIAASVGDSRGVLAALPDPSLVMKQSQEKTFPKKGGKYRRPIVPTRHLAAVQLTIDQKPNHQEEMERIIKSGGRVSRLTDEQGNRIGPYRIWRQNGNLPGLAMSRSIGDKMASEIGVISTPIVQQLEHSPGQDQFIVVASDGIW